MTCCFIPTGYLCHRYSPFDENCCISGCLILGAQSSFLGRNNGDLGRCNPEPFFRFFGCVRLDRVALRCVIGSARPARPRAGSHIPVASGCIRLHRSDPRGEKRAKCRSPARWRAGSDRVGAGMYINLVLNGGRVPVAEVRWTVLPEV